VASTDLEWRERGVAHDAREAGYQADSDLKSGTRAGFTSRTSGMNVIARHQAKTSTDYTTM